MERAILSLFLGLIIITILDRRWFDIDHKKIEQGYEVLEHYHFGIILITIAILFASFSSPSFYDDPDAESRLLFLTSSFSPFFTLALLGAGMALIYHEAMQKNYFAHKSKHFKNSTIIGLILTAILLLTLYYF